MSTETTIRFARREDLQTLVRFNQAMARETESKELIPEVLSAGVAALFDRPELGFYVVAQQNDEVVGCLMITTEWSDWRNGSFWWIQSVYVLPQARRQGIYRRLYEFVRVEAGSKQDVCGFRLYVERENVSAQKTYASLGMVETEYKLYEDLKRDIRFYERAA